MLNNETDTICVCIGITFLHFPTIFGQGLHFIYLLFLHGTNTNKKMKHSHFGCALLLFFMSSSLFDKDLILIYSFCIKIKQD